MLFHLVAMLTTLSCAAVDGPVPAAEAKAAGTAGSALTLGPGSRIRFSARSFLEGGGLNTLDRDQKFTGTLVGFEGGKLVVDLEDTKRTARFDAGAIRNLEVSTKRPSAGKRVLAGAGIGFGVVTSALLMTDDRCDCPTIVVAGGLLLGVPLGAVVGAFTADEKWRKVEDPQSGPVAIVQPVRKGVRLSVALGF